MTPGAHQAPRPTLVGLARAETRRYAARRLVRWLLFGALVGFVGVVVFMGVRVFAQASPELVAQAKAKAHATWVEQEGYRQQCLKDMAANPPEGQENVPPEQLCGGPMRESDFPYEQFLDRTPFSLTAQTPLGTVGVGVVVGVLLFLLSASFVGAEWHHRTLMAQLFWEPRRVRVLAVKAVVVALYAAVVAAFFQVLWVGAAHVLASTRGVVDGTAAYWSTTVGDSVRAVTFGVLFALVGFALAHLVRGTGAALGVALGYLLVVENAVNVLKPAWTPYLLTTNTGALLQRGGLTIPVPELVVTKTGAVENYREVLLTSVHGATVLAVVALALLVVGAVLFRRRDLT